MSEFTFHHNWLRHYAAVEARMALGGSATPKQIIETAKEFYAFYTDKPPVVSLKIAENVVTEEDMEKLYAFLDSKRKGPEPTPEEIKEFQRFLKELSPAEYDKLITRATEKLIKMGYKP